MLPMLNELICEDLLSIDYCSFSTNPQLFERNKMSCRLAITVLFLNLMKGEIILDDDIWSLALK